MRKLICLFLALLLCTIGAIAAFGGKTTEKNYIKYVEFNVTQEALQSAVDYDIDAYEKGKKLSFIDILAYLGAKYGGDFKKYKSKDMSSFVEEVNNGSSIKEITKDMKYFSYYQKAYGAVLNGMVGEYSAGNGDSKEKHYGIRWYCPIAKTFPYTGYDDFGAKRTFGYSRPHLGHDMMAATGTPVIAVESGKVECMGWNRYGGWRIGIRSNDSQRYWYYAHLRQNRPYAENLKEGDEVKAGQVIGYVGRTGYSDTENTNNIEESHLHIGLELVFDESQKESDNEIWVNLFALTNVLDPYRSEVVRNSETKEFKSVNQKIYE